MLHGVGRRAEAVEEVRMAEAGPLLVAGSRVELQNLQSRPEVRHPSSAAAYSEYVHTAD